MPDIRLQASPARPELRSAFLLAGGVHIRRVRRPLRCSLLDQMDCPQAAARRQYVLQVRAPPATDSMVRKRQVRLPYLKAPCNALYQSRFHPEWACLKCADRERPTRLFLPKARVVPVWRPILRLRPEHQLPQASPWRRLTREFPLLPERPTEWSTPDPTGGKVPDAQRAPPRRF